MLESVRFAAEDVTGKRVYLKSLVLKGFKSFADRSVLKLEPGMTVVVGPNGSGKSNISDAVLWVLGEQSAKQLRGQAMEDVIFAGSSARKAVGLAEVDLVLDNADGTLPLDFTEVVITRRMYRSGESEYLINGAPSRLMDVQDILNDSGLGRDTHSIISQGSLNNVLRARPEDRRVLVEEAAGILKHKKRKERASRKLKNMDAELARVKDVAAEIDRQLKPLERQASKARRHEQLAAELKDVQLVLAVDDLRELQEQWARAEKLEREADANVELVRFRLAERQRELEKYQRLLEERGLFVGDIAEQRRRCQSVLERLDAGMLLLEEKGRNMVSRLSELRQTIHRSNSRHASLSEQLERDEGEHRDALARKTELEAQLAEQERTQRETADARTQADARVAEASRELRLTERELDECSLAAMKATESLSTADTEDGLLVSRMNQIDDQLAATATTLRARRQRLAELEEQLAQLQDDTRAMAEQLDERTRALADAQAALEQARSSQADAQAELKGLREVESALDDANPMLAWTLSHDDAAWGELAPLGELFSAPPELDACIEQLLGPDACGLMAHDMQAAAALADALAQADVADGTLCLVAQDGNAPARDRAAYGTPLLDMLSYDDGHARVVELLFGDVFVVETIEQATRAAAADSGQHRFVTRDGLIAHSDGKLTLGTRSAQARGLLARKRRIAELADELPALEGRIAAAQDAVAAAQDALGDAQERSVELSKQCAAASGEESSLRAEIGRLEQSVTGLSQEREEAVARREKLAEESSSLRDTLAGFESDRERLQQRRDECAEKLAVEREQRDEALQREEACRRDISATKVELATVRERELHLARQLESLARERDSLANSLSVSRETEASLEILRLRVEPLYAVFTELRAGITEKAELLRDQAQLEQAGQGDLRDTIAQARSSVAEANAEVEAANEKLTNVRIDKSRLEVKVENAVRVITEENGVLLDIALETPPPDDRAACEQRARKLEKRLGSIGAVNPVAIEEYRALKERRDFITLQIDDLEGARTSLTRIVAAIDRKMRNRFLETFEQVNANFEEIFSQLFPGGEGHLELTDRAHPELTGVEVHAQPRGKTVHKQTLLSGGEQSLVAMALMFAVYKVRSTPFYILDEVEAALDDTNLRRFLSYLDGIRAHTQFIIISHQRRTMEMADMLYGVSMRGDGVSKLVSQKLDQAIRLSSSTSAPPRDVESFSGAR